MTSIHVVACSCESPPTLRIVAAYTMRRAAQVHAGRANRHVASLVRRYLDALFDPAAPWSGKPALLAAHPNPWDQAMTFHGDAPWERPRYLVVTVELREGWPLSAWVVEARTAQEADPAAFFEGLDFSIWNRHEDNCETDRIDRGITEDHDDH